MSSPEKVRSLPDRKLESERKLAAVRDAGSLICSEKGIIKACEHNARTLIEGASQFVGLHFDDFLSRMRASDRDWSDGDDLEALCWLQSTHGVAGFTLSHTRNACKAIAYSRRRDSLRAFVESLPAWDGVPRIGTAFCEAWGAREDPLTCAASSNLFIAMIARALEPGAQVDTAWCLEGPQGTFKSKSLRELGGHFHAEISAPIGTADFMRELRGVWLAELSELDALHGREPSTVKRLLSAPTDRFVQKYALHAESYPRRAIAIATTNEANYWKDPTGARRLIPIACTEIRIDLIAANRLQWLAEALHRYRAGATWWQFPAEMADFQDERQQVDPWEDVLSGMIARGRRTGEDGQGLVPWPDGFIASADIMRDWLHLEPHQQGHNAGVRLGQVMRRLGFTRKRVGHTSERGWIRADTSKLTDKQVSADVSAPFPL